MIDIHGILVRELRADPDVAALVGKQVYARVLPDRVNLPACKVLVPAISGATDPAPTWQAYIGQVDSLASNHQEALAIAQAVQNALFDMEGRDITGAVFQSVDAHSVESGYDEDWSPPKPKWSVLFTITARQR